MSDLPALIEAQKQESFTDPSTASDEDALGVLISHHTEWDGAAILRIAAFAMEDANFHSEAETLNKMAEAL